MEVARASEGRFDHGEEARFTGDVWLRQTLTAADGTNIGVVHFAPGSRTHWHRHPSGQWLYGVAGRGRVRTRGQAGSILEPGNVFYVGPDEWHFHGATPEAPVVHVAVNGGGAPELGGPVDDSDYGESF
jgi:quercetin dioxygenase-like cupin family protein